METIIISDDSEMDSEEEEEENLGSPESVIGTVTLRPIRGTEKLNRYVSVCVFFTFFRSFVGTIIS